VLFPDATGHLSAFFYYVYAGICAPIGRRRTRLPVAAKIALQSAKGGSSIGISCVLDDVRVRRLSVISPRASVTPSPPHFDL
jgi:hypothetical protein